MRACVIHGKHDLQVEDRPTPAPSPQEVLVKLGAGGICGSDLHYFHEGRVGAFEVREPMVLGHEVAGEVVELGRDVTRVNLGDRVAVNPARPCGTCTECLTGKGNLCQNVRFFGSAARFPHVSGAFSEVFLAHESQCIPIGSELSYIKAACAEPLAVALHAVKRAGDVRGKRVLITGAGPIGLLTLMAVRFHGAAKIAITDQMDEPLEVARILGANTTVNVARRGRSDEDFDLPAGTFDIAIEAAGALAALDLCINSVRPGGRIVQLGSLPAHGSESFSLSRLVAREIELVGSFRFYEEYERAVALLQSGQIDPTALLTSQLPLAEAVSAFHLASDRTRALKVSLVL